MRPASRSPASLDCTGPLGRSRSHDDLSTARDRRGHLVTVRTANDGDAAAAAMAGAADEVIMLGTAIGVGLHE
jgi:hypothetical protein